MSMNELRPPDLKTKTTALIEPVGLNNTADHAPLEIAPDRNFFPRSKEKTLIQQTERVRRASTSLRQQILTANHSKISGKRERPSLPTDPTKSPVSLKRLQTAPRTRKMDTGTIKFFLSVQSLGSSKTVSETPPLQPDDTSLTTSLQRMKTLRTKKIDTKLIMDLLLLHPENSSLNILPNISE